ncbi:hypothetical protein Nepgr_010305 [Nepenthes gracilis]|uniref:Uncharacterized protein n=1 Tax=Nepenthes gracilis TaxID=150966 RepID=A0AAD3SC55_NEPGR|nr:hypothetical protein Nepgr_010305 [Nepenthes gracilis]
MDDDGAPFAIPLSYFPAHCQPPNETGGETPEDKLLIQENNYNHPINDIVSEDMGRRGSWASNKHNLQQLPPRTDLE